MHPVTKNSLKKGAIILILAIGTIGECRAQSLQENDAEIAGAWLKNLIISEKAGRSQFAGFLGNAATYTRTGGKTDQLEKSSFLDVWEKNLGNRRIVGIQTARTKRNLLNVQIIQENPMDRLTHQIEIDTEKEPDELKTILLEILPSQTKKNTITWRSNSLREAESYAISQLSEKNLTWKEGTAFYEEGDTLESSSFQILEENTERKGATFILRDKKTGETTAATEFETEENPNFKSARTAAARAGFEIFKARTARK